MSKKENYSNSDLMRDQGSKTGRYDPEAPDQWLYELRHGTGETKMIAYLKSKTTALGHQSPYATYKGGHKAMKIPAMAAELGCAERTVRNVLNELSKQGRVRVDEQGRVWLCADVPLAHIEDSAEEKLPEDPDDDFVQSHFSGYLADSVRALPVEKLRTLKAKYEAYDPFRPKLFADSVALTRYIDERIQDSMLSSVGIHKKRLKDPKPPQSDLIRLELIKELDFVQSQELPLCTDVHSAVYTAETRSVQSENGGASLLSSDTDTDSYIRRVENGRNSASTPSLEKDNVQRAGGRSQEAPAHPPQTSISAELQTGLEQRGYGYLLADDGAIRSLVSDLADTPLDLYWGILDERLQRARGSKQTLGLPILRDKARQARKTWERQTAAKSAQREEATQPHSREAIREALLTLADPHADPDLKTLAQEMLDQDRAAQPKARAAGGVS